MSELAQNIPRTLDEPAKILGVTPLEWVACAVFYTVCSMILRGVPFGALLSLAIVAVVGGVTFILNRSFPPDHGLHFLLSVFRSEVTPVMADQGDFDE